MPGSRNTSCPNLGTVMVFCAATRCTDGPGAPAWASVAPNGAVAATVHPATAMAAYRNLHRGLFMALFSSAVGSLRCTRLPNQQTPEQRLALHPRTADICLQRQRFSFSVSAG